MRADLATALNDASPTLRARLLGELHEQLEFLERDLLSGERVIRILSGFSRPLLIALTSRRLLIVTESLAVTSYKLTQVITFVVAPPERSWLTNDSSDGQGEAGQLRFACALVRPRSGPTCCSTGPGTNPRASSW